MKRSLLFNIKTAKFLLLVIPVILCGASTADGFKLLDLGVFKITIPNNWKYKKLDGQDSFIGEILIAPKTSLYFDFSRDGFASSLIPTEQEYIKRNEWKRACYFCKAGVTYTSDFNVKNERITQMKKLGTTDSTKVHVEKDPSYETKTFVRKPNNNEHKKFPKVDYIGELTWHDSTILIPITLPAEIKTHNIRVDTTNKYIVKTIWPKVSGYGGTGIYFKARASRLTFNLVGRLSAQQQKLALEAFKTIVINE